MQYSTKTNIIIVALTLCNFLSVLPRCPEIASVQAKMLYASSKDAVKKKLNGIGFEFQASELSDICYQDVLDKMISKCN